MMAVSIRSAVVEVVSVIMDFIRRKAEFDGCPGAVEATPERIRETLFGPAPLAGVLLAVLEGRAVGFAAYSFTFSTFLARPGVWMDDLFVDEPVRGRGIGLALLRHLSGLALEKGCGRIEWTAAGANHRGLAFYRRHGASVREATRLCRLDRDAIGRLAGESS
jgi:GNAT superfamily N-acetyltransferase